MKMFLAVCFAIGAGVITMTAHRHTGPVCGYVLEGEYEHAMDDEPIRSYKAGVTVRMKDKE